MAVSLAAAVACRRPAEEPAPPGPKPPPSDARPTRGVKVPLADGWSAGLGEEQSLSVGPAGRAVLRIDLRPGAAASKPDASALRRLFSSSFDSGVAAEISSKDEPGTSWVTFRLGGGKGAGEPALLGAKVLGEDLFLCATLPGATEAEVESAARACEGIAYSAGP